MEEKLKALKRLDNGETLLKVAQDYNVGKTTVGDWKRNRNDIEKWCSQRVTATALEDRKTMKKCEYEKVSEALYLWFTQHRDKGVPISGPILHQKALKFRNELNEGEPDFTASVGWLDRWKKRYGIRQLNICGEKLSANCEAVKSFRDKLHTLLDKENISGDQIFNCDETGLNYKLLPSKTLASKAEAAAPGYKRSKERVTILACSNATANMKMKLAMIGKSKNPRAFKNVSKNALPVKYYSQKNAWMSSDIFKEWFFKEFVPQTEQFLKSKNLPRKAILLLDNATCHPDEDELKDREIKIMFLPPNVTSLCQPMDQGTLEAMKRNYRRNLLSSLIDAMDQGEDMVNKLRHLNLKDVAYYVAQAWESVGANTVAKSWKVLLQENVESPGDENVEKETEPENTSLLPLLQQVPGCANVTEEDVNEWIAQDEQYEVTDEEIVNMANGKGGEDDEEDMVLEESAQKVSNSEGHKALEIALKYAEQLEETSSTDVLLLRRLRDLAARKRQTAGKQKTITNFFTQT